MSSLKRTDLVCSICGCIQTIQRRQGRERCELHIKNLYCPECKEDRKFIELVDKDKFYNKLIRKDTLNELELHVLKLLEEGKKVDEKKYRYIR